MPTVLELRVLLLMPSEADGERAARILAEHGLVGTRCGSIEALLDEVSSGVGTILLTDEVLTEEAEQRLEATLRAQPAWSALPVVLLARENRSTLRALGAYDHVVIVERPARVRSLVSAVQSALRARRNQYNIRQAMAEREEQAAALIAQDEKLRFALAAGRLGSWAEGSPRLASEKLRVWEFRTGARS